MVLPQGELFIQGEKTLLTLLAMVAASDDAQMSNATFDRLGLHIFVGHLALTRWGRAVPVPDVVRPETQSLPSAGADQVGGNALYWVACDDQSLSVR